MSTIAFWNPLAANGLPAAVSAAPARLSPPPLTVVSACRLSPVRKPQVITIFHRPTRPSFLVQAVADDELGSENKTQKGALGGLAVVEEETNGAASVIPELKRKLIDQLFGTDRGLKASSETRAEVNEIISQLEAKNPTPAPTEALSLLNGKWILAYTSFVGLFPLLRAGSLTQLVKVDEISQTIDSEALTVQNSVRFVGPFSTTSVSTNAKFEVRSPKRVQVVTAVKSDGGDQAVLQTLNRAQELYINRLRADAAANELASLFAECAIAEARPQNPLVNPSLEQLDATNLTLLHDVSDASILAQSGRMQIMLDAFADGSSFICLKCGGLVSNHRRDEHLMYWCG